MAEDWAKITLDKHAEDYTEGEDAAFVEGRRSGERAVRSNAMRALGLLEDGAGDSVEEAKKFLKIIIDRSNHRWGKDFYGND